MVGNLAPFGPYARNYSTSASRIYSYFPQNSTAKQIGVDVSPFGTVKVRSGRLALARRCLVVAARPSPWHLVRHHCC